MSLAATGLLSLDDAQARLFALVEPVAAETLPLNQAAGRWVAADLIALRTQPAADLSAMDGYAIRHADLPGPWTIIGESAAGQGFGQQVGVGEAVRIFTGAPLPPGTDTILVQEEATRDGSALTLSGEGPTRRSSNVRRRGLDFTEGAPLITRGTRLTPARIALAAAAGHSALSVNRPIRVAILATGDELRPAGAALNGTQLPESNGLMLAALLADLPVVIEDYGIVPDRLEALVEALRSAAQADVIVTTGGASVGDHDLVRPALEALGATIDFWRVALRPGKPLLAAQLGCSIVLGLPGNPVSAFVTAVLFLKPLIAVLAGATDPHPRLYRAELGEDLPANGPRLDFLRAEHRDGRVHPLPVQDSSMLSTLARADCLIRRSPHAPIAHKREIAEILPLA